MNKRKILLVVLLLILAVAILTACGGECYTVTFMVDGEVYETVTINSKDTSEVTLPTAPTKDGCTFAGWYTNSYLTVAFDENSVSASIIVYAKWIENSTTADNNTDIESSIDTESDDVVTYTIIFDSNGGSDISSIEIKGEQKVVLPADPTRTGYTFEGWYTDNSLTTLFTATTITEDIKLYAKWEELAPTEGLEFTLNSAGTEYIVIGTGTATNTYIVIPNTYNGLPVTGIYSYAFHNYTSLTSVVIPNSVTSIGSYAFEDCSNLTYVYYNGSVADWFNISFENAYSNPMYYADNFYIKDSSGNYYLLTELEIPDSVTAINGYAFCGFSCFTSVIIGDSVTSIGYMAFAYCTNLISVVITDSVTSIGSSAFRYCSSLTKVVNLSSLTITAGSTGYGYVGYYAEVVVNIAASSNFTIDDNGYVLESNDNGIIVVAYLGYDTSLVIPDKITGIGDYAFLCCSSLTSLVIPDSVTNIGDCAFLYCSSLTSLVIPDSVTSIGNSALSGCSSLASLTIPFVGSSQKRATYSYQYPLGYIFGTTSYTGGTATIQYYYGSYYYGSGSLSTTSSTYFIPTTLTSVTITGTYVNAYAFYNCRSLTSVTIGDSVTSIGDYAFIYCYKLVEVCNLSNLSITAGSSSNGYIGYYAINVYTDTQGESKLSTDSNGYILYTDGEDVILVGYIGTATEITIQNSVTEIYQRAFYNNDNLSSVVIPESVTNIGAYAFYHCTSLQTLTIGNEGSTANDVEIDTYAFQYCTSLTDIHVYSNLTTTATNQIELYQPFRYSGSSDTTTNLIIGDNVTSIGSDVFYYFSYLNTVTIGDSVTSISSSAFGNCKTLTRVEIGNSVTSIGYGSFKDCTSLTSVVIPDSVTSIGYSAFSNCSSLTDVYYNGSIEDWCNISFGNENSNPMYYASNFYMLDSDDNYYLVTDLQVVIPDSVTAINNYVFTGFSCLTSVVIPDSVTSIGTYAFYNCTSLETLTSGNENSAANDVEIGDRAFQYCTSLTDIYVYSNLISSSSYEPFRYSGSSSTTTNLIIGDNVTYIGSYVFYYFSNLSKVTIGNSVTSIDIFAFYNCSSLTEVYYHSISIKYWCNILFGNSSANPMCYADNFYILADNNEYYLFTVLAIPYSVTQINSYSFYGFSCLTSVLLGYSLTSIDSYAFCNCTNLTSVEIGSSVTSIGYRAFYNCTSLTSVTFSDATSVWYLTSMTGSADAARSVGSSATAATYLKSTYCSYSWCKL